MSDTVFDLDAIDNEANGRRFEFTFKGQTYSLATGDDCDWRVMDALPKGELAEAMRYLMGDEQYTRFVASSATTRSLKALLAKWSAFRGDESGEALASSNS